MITTVDPTAVLGWDGVAAHHAKREGAGAVTSFSDELWTSAEWIYQEILAHPFITGLTDGSLPTDAFRHFIVQDAHYLRGFARALTICAA